MPFKIRYEVRCNKKKAAVITTHDKSYAKIECRDLQNHAQHGELFYVASTVEPHDLTKPEQYLYLVYEVRELERMYFDRGRDKDVFKEALAKESELDRWNDRTRQWLDAHPGATDHYQGDKADNHLFFLLVERWRHHWKEYFKTKKQKDASQALVSEMYKACRDFERRIDEYITKKLES